MPIFVFTGKAIHENLYLFTVNKLPYKATILYCHIFIIIL